MASSARYQYVGQRNVDISRPNAIKLRQLIAAISVLSSGMMFLLLYQPSHAVEALFIIVPSALCHAARIYFDPIRRNIEDRLLYDSSLAMFSNTAFLLTAYMHVSFYQPNLMVMTAISITILFVVKEPYYLCKNYVFRYRREEILDDKIANILSDLVKSSIIAMLGMSVIVYGYNLRWPGNLKWQGADQGSISISDAQYFVFAFMSGAEPNLIPISSSTYALATACSVLGIFLIVFMLTEITTYTTSRSSNLPNLTESVEADSMSSGDPEPGIPGT